MQTRNSESEGAARARGMRGIAAILGGCIALSSTAHASEVGATSPELVSGAPLWLASLPATSAVTLGRNSTSIKQVAASALANRYPCAAVALTLFDPPPKRETEWQLLLEGAPTPATVALIIQNADARQIGGSIRALGAAPYDPDRALQLSISVSSRTLTSNTSVSTVACDVIDTNGVSLQRLELPIRFTWRTADARLLGVYEDTSVTAAVATASVK